MLAAQEPQHGTIPDEEERARLARMVIELFRHWQLNTSDQLMLLGHSETNRPLLTRYASGAPLARSRDLIDRVGLLLGIHKNLRLLLPEQPELAYQWMSRENRAFDGKRPVDVVRERGLIGLYYLRSYLDRARGE